MMLTVLGNGLERRVREVRTPALHTCISARRASSCSRTTLADTRLLRRPDACQVVGAI